jgi:hypothetical protein
MENTVIAIPQNTDNVVAKMLINIVKTQYEKKEKKDIWKLSEWSHIAELENDYVGGVGETFLHQLCISSNIPAEIDGTKTKELGGGCGDGIINGRSIEIKTARAGTGDIMSFQHELGEKPWHADFMCFVDIAPDKFYITIFPNFTEEQYKQCSKCEPYFPTRSFCWRKKSGCFKLDTTEKLNETQSKITDNHTLAWNKDTSIDNVRQFINKIVTPK